VVHLTDASDVAFDWLNGDVGTLRRDYARVRAKPVPPDAAWIRAGQVDVLRFPGHGGERRAIVYFHGGGFIVGSPATHADVAVRLARHTRLPVYSVDYRLAPEHRAPAPALDGIAVIGHLVATGVEELIICGDSAGGAVALATEASLPDNLRRHVICIASFYGAHGLLDTPSIRSRGNLADGTDARSVARYFRLAGEEAYSIETLAKPSPVPVYLVAAEEDALRDDSLILARALEGQGRQVVLDRVHGADHGFLHGDETNHLAERAMDRFAKWLAR
jgi:acetyl esterase/lipase